MRRDPIATGFIPNPEQLEIASDKSIGLRFGEKGTHTSRTMMLRELRMLLDVANSSATKEDYRGLVVEDNVLDKRTTATRKLSYQRLSELYILDPSALIFRIFHLLWNRDIEGRPLLALLTALSRDPLLRATAPTILHLKPGEELSKQDFIDALAESVGSRLNESILQKVVRNTASSWTQSGHLTGRSRKIRRSVAPTPSVVAFALLLGYILGARGEVLLKTLWSRTLDSSREHLIELALDAKRLGIIDMTYAGGIMEVSPTRLLTDEERRLIHGTN